MDDLSDADSRQGMIPPMMAAYMLRCADDTYYVGSSRNLEHRMMQHYSGKGAEYTSTRLPVELVWYEEFDRIDEAYAREKQVQRWSRAKREALIEGRIIDLKALAKKDFGETGSRYAAPRLLDQLE